MTKLTNCGLPDRKETILTIAEEVFARYSFDGASIRLISEKLGVNSAMIGYYFGSKEALYFNIFKVRLKDVGEEISRFEQLDLDPAEKLKAYLAAYINRIISNRNFHRLLYNELVSVQHPSITSQISAARNHIHNFLLEVIENGIAKGCFKKTDTEIFVLNILAFVPSVFADRLTTRSHFDQESNEDFPRRMVDYIMAILTPEGIH